MIGIKFYRYDVFVLELETLNFEFHHVVDLEPHQFLAQACGGANSDGSLDLPCKVVKTHLNSNSNMCWS